MKPVGEIYKGGVSEPTENRARQRHQVRQKMPTVTDEPIKKNTYCNG